jgi:ribosomal protein S6--L-glutamate ligase
MKIGYWKVQIDIGQALQDKGYKSVPLDWHAQDWHKMFSQNICDGYIWYPHALHAQWFKLWDRAFFIEKFLGKKCFPSSDTAYLFQDKQHQKYIFDYFKLPTPKTEILTTKEQAEKFFAKTAYPVLSKDIWGYGGHGIHKISNKKEAQEYLRKKRMPVTEDKVARGHYIYIQKMIPIKEEYRVMTVGKKVVLAYAKRSDQLLKHVWRGAEVSFNVEPKIKNLVRRWNRKLDLDWCGWDLAKDERGRIFLLELNPIFGTKVLEQQGINLADHLVEYLDKKMKK